MLPANRNRIKKQTMSVDANELYNVKAGRAIRRGTTNFVDPQDVKGSITVFTDGNGLLHFGWQNRTTQDVELVCTIQ